MPELPEVRAHAERLGIEFGGAELDGFKALSFTALKTFTPNPSDAKGVGLTGAGSRGKYIYLCFGDLGFIIHLMQGGRLKPDPKQTRKPRGGLARWTFADGRALLLTEAGTEHSAGVWLCAGDPRESEIVAHLGIEADEITADELAEVAAVKGRRLHGFLRDQRSIAGLGRRLANEICHAAKLSPFANTKKLDGEEIERLLAAIRTCVDTSLDYERSRPDMSSSKDRPSAVHSRSGEDCPMCGTDKVRTVEYRAYTVSYCPTCQTSGKLLADNTTSKFLK